MNLIKLAMLALVALAVTLILMRSVKLPLITEVGLALLALAALGAAFGEPGRWSLALAMSGGALSGIGLHRAAKAARLVEPETGA